MIQIKDEHLIAEGFHRRCYIHPLNDSLCIKVGKLNIERERVREQKYYKRLQVQGIDWELLPQYYGEEQTNLGVGDVFDLIKDDNKNPSKTLEYYINNHIPEGTTSALVRLEKYLLDNAIVTLSIKPRNVVLQKRRNEVINAVIVDDIGNTEFVPLSNVSKYFARLKIRRKLKRFRKILGFHEVSVEGAKT